MQSNTLPTQDRTPLFCADIYPSSTFYESDSPDTIHQNLTSLAALLQKFINDHCKDTLEGYIWYREPLKVSVADQTDDGEKPARLCASMRHGGSVEDEWLAVHLLILASEKFQDEPSARGFCANVYDEDGQFLMIEGAEELPDWLNPNNADGRLWIMGGAFHLLTLEHHPGDDEVQTLEASLEEGKSLKHITALKALQSRRDTVASPQFVETLQRNRMPTFPELGWAQDCQHSTVVYLPMLAAKLVSRYPQIIADAAEAFEGREGPKDARTLRDLSVFGGQGGPAFLIRIKIPRRMYAMLLGERYFPPKVFGAEWRESVMKYWDALEEERGDKTVAEGEIAVKEEGRRRDLGCKIVCGLELMHSNVKSRMLNNPKNLFDVQDDQMREAEAYQQFIKSLSRQGYFDGELQDSYQWKEKEREALKIWRSASQSKNDEHTSDELGFVLDAVKACAQDRSLPPYVDAQKGAKALRLYEDPDDWVYEEGETANEDAEGIAMEQLNAFKDKMQTFFEGEGGQGLFEEDEEEEEEEENEAEKRRRALEELIPPLPEGEWGAKAGKSDKQSVEMEGVSGKSRLKGFTSYAEYDGVCDVDEDEEDEILRAGDAEEDRMRRARALGIEREYEEEEMRFRMAVEDGDVGEEWGDGEDEEEFAIGEKEVVEFIEFARAAMRM
ncbi:uncharacterized protein FA14DRAFT_161858 [Meira miltonrushii]|uniref:SGT1-domain-containing protein n=1 Tax=Meira miltonrushii TaxID=1280837 RepID=A0A316V4C7_9BASI|nr:uncharacterized protein FA14DRAFT_161858 [Meira miltonrushii]PWN32409.1 hypothetical protein FA14DRAFT_161858 [Meira miltonrushii]